MILLIGSINVGVENFHGIIFLFVEIHIDILIFSK